MVSKREAAFSQRADEVTHTEKEENGFKKTARRDDCRIRKTMRR